ncbi:flavodoxin family protein [Scatolibacter rhodanostii]|uniref:flavodoxin family protein n=1 Tax=Scatolibacter rhodanostii TaxID=2014781 RepID=UPI000C085DAD|nr:NAD(P)H-dependent oxidoreductase [Scatolibacter rhodanostii]
MKITIIHGQSHKGSTYHIAELLAKKIGGKITEFFLPRDFDKFCIGCSNCFMKGESMCPHYTKLTPLTEAIDSADVLIFASPVYVYHATGSMKAFLDHYGYRWMVHRPHAPMFNKQAVCISTAAGAGMKSTNKDMADSMFFWGVGKIYQYGVGVQAIDYKGVPDKIKQKIEKKTSSLADKIKSKEGHVAPGLKTKAFFNIMRMVMKKGWNQADMNYWKDKGWTEKNRPW